MRSTTKRLELPRAGLAAGAVGTALVIGLLLVRVSGEATPAPAPPAPVSAPTESAPAPAPTPPPPSAAGLRLHGLLGRGAVIALPDGRQRFFAIGREVRPGLKVERIEPQAVILASAGGELRLGFEGVGPSDSAAQRAAAATPEDALADETLRYRLGLAPRRVGTRTRYVVRPGAQLPALERAGLRPGDLILSVNGSGFDEERMLELAWEIANSPRTEFAVERGGRTIRLALDGGR